MRYSSAEGSCAFAYSVSGLRDISPAFQYEGLRPGVQTRHECSIDLMTKYSPRESDLRHGVVSHLELGALKQGLSGEMIVARIAGCAVLLLSMVACGAATATNPLALPKPGHHELRVLSPTSI